MQMSIRKATTSDLSQLADIEQQVYGDSGFNCYYFRQMLDLFPDLLWVWDNCDGILAGYALGAFGQVREEGWVMSLAVSPGFRGKGLAAKLSQVLLEALQNCRCQSVLLTVSETNLAAVSLYRKLGFDDFCKEADYYGPGQDRLVMKHTF